MERKIVKVTDIKPNPDNPRIIKDDKYKKLVQSLKDFPEMSEAREIVVNKDMVILGGNMRYRAMREAGWKEVPVKIVDWSEDKQREFVIKDNAGFGEWDYDALGNTYEPVELDAWGVDLPEFEDKTEVEEDEPPAVDDVAPPASQVGEVYQLGRHRLMCGDSTKREDVERLMDGKKADMVFTDPPYFVGLTSTGLTISQADKSNILHFFNAWMANIAQFVNGHWYICTDWRTYPVIQEAAVMHLGRMTNLIVWDFEWIKAGSQYRFTHELIMFGDRENKRQVPRSEPDVWRLQATNFTTERLHGAQKPVGLSERAISNSSDEGSSILDLFLGSGSTLIACEQTDRTCYGMELDPRYCDVIRKRYWKFVNGTDEGWEVGTPVVAGNMQGGTNG